MKGPKNILIIGQFPPPNHGVSAINELVYTGLVGDFNCTRLALNFNKDFGSLNQFGLKKAFQFIWIFFRLFWFLLSKDISKVYFSIVPTGIGLKRDVLLVLLLRFFKKKVVFHLHGKGVDEAYPQNKKWYKWAFKHQTIITLSARLQKELTVFEFPVKTYVVQNPVLQYKPVEKKHTKEPTILFFANLFLFKGWDRFLDIAKGVQSVWPDVKVRIVGYFPNAQIEQEILKKITALELNHVELFGGCKQEEKWQHFASCSVLIYPTRNDAYPLVLLEAMRSGIPIVSTGLGGIPDLLDNGGRGDLIEPYNEELFVHQTLQVLKFGSTKTVQAQKWAATECSEERFLKNIASILAE